MNAGDAPRALPIAKSSVRAGIPLRAALGDEVSYEWFYVEVASGGDHLVAIFSLLDPFRGEAGHREASLYLTWHRGGEVEDYAYALFEGAAGDDFRARVETFFSRALPAQRGTPASHATPHAPSVPDRLEITLPSHALSHDLTLHLTWSEVRAETPPVATPSETARFVAEAQGHRAQGVRHVWQPLALGHALGGCLFRSHVRARSAATGATRVGPVHDLPLARKLQRNARRPLPASTDAFAAEAFAFEAGEAWCYVDHNAGFERLSGVAEPWLWWHARLDATPGAGTTGREIGYWFPERRDGHLVALDPSSEGLTQARTFEGRDPLRDPFRAGFGVQAARGVELARGTVLAFPHVIEAAPFYARLKAMDAQGRHLGTLEALHPARLASPWTPLLMSCRQLKVRTLGTGYGSRAFLETCRAVTAANGRSFYLASHVLPPAARAGAYVVYTLCRLIDDATDEAQALRAALGESAAASLEGSRHAAALLDALFPEGARAPQATREVEAFLDAALVATGAWRPESPGEGNRDSKPGVRARAFLLEARACARTLGLERVCFEELVAGQKMDEAFLQPANAAEFRLYCFRVAGVVGLLMARVFGAGLAPATLEAAESLGIAMQITNILRDVREDFLTRERIYLPADACARHGVDVRRVLADADAGHLPAGATALVRHLGLQAVDAYRTALRGVPDIPSFRARMCVRLMTAVYGAILGVILVDPSLPFRKRVVVPQTRRLLIALKVLLGTHPLAAAGLSKRRSAAH